MSNDQFRKEVDKLPAIQLPRACEFDDTMVVVTDRGIRCPKCGHEVLDIPRESERSGILQTCHCFNCSKKREREASIGKPK